MKKLCRMKYYPKHFTQFYHFHVGCMLTYSLSLGHWTAWPCWGLRMKIYFLSPSNRCAASYDRCVSTGFARCLQGFHLSSCLIATTWHQEKNSFYFYYWYLTNKDFDSDLVAILPGGRTFPKLPDRDGILREGQPEAGVGRAEQAAMGEACSHEPGRSPGHLQVWLGTSGLAPYEAPSGLFYPLDYLASTAGCTSRRRSLKCMGLSAAPSSWWMLGTEWRWAYESTCVLWFSVLDPDQKGVGVPGTPKGTHG